MLAEEFGYQLSPQPAVEITPAVKTMVEEQLALFSRGKPKEGIGCFILLMIFVLSIAAATQAFLVLVFGLPVAGLVALSFGESQAKGPPSEARRYQVHDGSGAARRVAGMAVPTRTDSWEDPAAIAVSGTRRLGCEWV